MIIFHCIISFTLKEKRVMANFQMFIQNIFSKMLKDVGIAVLQMFIQNIFSKMLKDVGIEVLQSIETRFSIQAKAGDHSMQH